MARRGGQQNPLDRFDEMVGWRDYSVTLDQARQARLVVTGHARDAQDAHYLLAVLGLL